MTDLTDKKRIIARKLREAADQVEALPDDQAEMISLDREAWGGNFFAQGWETYTLILPGEYRLTETDKALIRAFIGDDR